MSSSDTSPGYTRQTCVQGLDRHEALLKRSLSLRATLSTLEAQILAYITSGEDEGFDYRGHVRTICQEVQDLLSLGGIMISESNLTPQDLDMITRASEAIVNKAEEIARERERKN